MNGDIKTATFAAAVARVRADFADERADLLANFHTKRRAILSEHAEKKAEYKHRRRVAYILQKKAEAAGDWDKVLELCEDSFELWTQRIIELDRNTQERLDTIDGTFNRALKRITQECRDKIDVLQAEMQQKADQPDQEGGQK